MGTGSILSSRPCRLRQTTPPRPMRVLRPALLLVALALAGCVEIVSTITVRADGSAVLRDRVTITMTDGPFGDGLSDSASGDPLPDKDALRQRAEALGPGVTLVGVVPAADGYTAVYAAPDVRALRYSLRRLGKEDGDADGALDVSFAFEPGDPATLRIVVPEDEPDEPPTEAEVLAATEGLGFLREVLGDARVEVHVEVEGRVVESDAAFQDGSRVTLAAFAFDDLFDALLGTEGLIESTPSGAIRTALAGREGVRIQEPGTVTVRFE